MSRRFGRPRVFYNSRRFGDTGRLRRTAHHWRAARFRRKGAPDTRRRHRAMVVIAHRAMLARRPQQMVRRIPLFYRERRVPPLVVLLRTFHQGSSAAHYKLTEAPISATKSPLCKGSLIRPCAAARPDSRVPSTYPQGRALGYYGRSCFSGLSQSGHTPTVCEKAATVPGR